MFVSIRDSPPVKSLRRTDWDTDLFEWSKMRHTALVRTGLGDVPACLLGLNLIWEISRLCASLRGPFLVNAEILLTSLAAGHQRTWMMLRRSLTKETRLHVAPWLCRSSDFCAHHPTSEILSLSELLLPAILPWATTPLPPVASRLANSLISHLDLPHQVLTAKLINIVQGQIIPIFHGHAGGVRALLIIVAGPGTVLDADEPVEGTTTWDDRHRNPVPAGEG